MLESAIFIIIFFKKSLKIKNKKTNTNKTINVITVAVKIGVGLALVVVGYLVLVKKAQTSECPAIQCCIFLFQIFKRNKNL